MVQEMDVNWTILGLSLAGALFFGVAYAWFVRWLASKSVEGQTAYLVVGGVTVAVLISIPSIGLLNAAILFAIFAACGLPMVLEYVARVHIERQRDLEAANALARESLDDDTSADR